jgi:hypothetical protein
MIGSRRWLAFGATSVLAGALAAGAAFGCFQRASNPQCSYQTTCYGDGSCSKVCDPPDGGCVSTTSAQGCNEYLLSLTKTTYWGTCPSGSCNITSGPSYDTVQRYQGVNVQC